MTKQSLSGAADLALPSQLPGPEQEETVQTPYVRTSTEGTYEPEDSVVAPFEHPSFRVVQEHLGAALAHVQQEETIAVYKPRALGPTEVSVKSPAFRAVEQQIQETLDLYQQELQELAAGVEPLARREASQAPPWIETFGTANEPDGPSAAQQLWQGQPQPTFAYLAGAAGCGKTFLARQWVDEVEGITLAATTGIAAINLGGTTINSLLGFFDTASLQEKYLSGSLRATLGRLWRSGVHAIVLDEVSMLSGDQLTVLKRAIDEVNTKDYVLGSKQEREHAEQFGVPSMKLLLVGDFAQLPAVKAPFAFESEEWGPFGDHTVTLTQVRRQADAAFIKALRATRLGDAGAVVDFFGPTLERTTDDTFEGVTLMAKNESVDRYNWLRLDRVQGKEVIFPSSREGEQRGEWGNPNKPPAEWGIPIRFVAKIGALVMILANKKYPKSSAFYYVNGDLGTIEDIATEPVPVFQGAGKPPIEILQPVCYVRLHRTGEVVRVTYVRREKVIPLDTARRRELLREGKDAAITEDGKSEIVGWVEYLPLRIAYATTVHKAQGLSMDAVQVSLGDHFFKTAGMLYVALSRARTAAGLRIVGSSAMLAERCTVHPKLVGRFL